MFQKIIPVNLKHSKVFFKNPVGGSSVYKQPSGQRLIPNFELYSVKINEIIIEYVTITNTKDVCVYVGNKLVLLSICLKNG